MTHICVSKVTIIGSDNGLSPGWRQTIIWTNANWTPGNKFQWNLIQDLYIFIQDNAFENVVWKMAAKLSQPQCVNTGHVPFPIRTLQHVTLNLPWIIINPTEKHHISSHWYCPHHELTLGIRSYSIKHPWPLDLDHLWHFSSFRMLLSTRTSASLTLEWNGNRRLHTCQNIQNDDHSKDNNDNCNGQFEISITSKYPVKFPTFWAVWRFS